MSIDNILPLRLLPANEFTILLASSLVFHWLNISVVQVPINFFSGVQAVKIMKVNKSITILVIFLIIFSINHLILFYPILKIPATIGVELVLVNGRQLKQ